MSRKLYHVEAEARRDQVEPDELLHRRQTLSQPVMDQLGYAIADLHNHAGNKSPIGRATTYAVNQRKTLSLYLTDPRTPSRTRTSSVSSAAIVRKNALFAGSDEGGRRMAILQTAMLLCELSGAPPFEYLRDVFTQLAGNWPQSRIAELFPAEWLKTHPVPED